jgi:transcription elongation factor Elf1
MKSGGFMHCKICKRRFELKLDNGYTAVKVETIFPLRTTSHDAFNCTFCGCQNIVGIREREGKCNEQSSVAREAN